MMPRLGWLALAFGLMLPGLAAAQDHALLQAVSEFDASLTVAPGWTRAADFDADGLEDVAAILDGGDRHAFVVFRATPHGYEIHPLYATLPNGDFDLRLLPPGRRRVLGAEGVLEHSAPALELVFPGRSSAIYAWRGGRFQIFATENY